MPASRLLLSSRRAAWLLLGGTHAFQALAAAGFSAGNDSDSYRYNPPPAYAGSAWENRPAPGKPWENTDHAARPPVANPWPPGYGNYPAPWPPFWGAPADPKTGLPPGYSPPTDRRGPDSWGYGPPPSPPASEPQKERKTERRQATAYPEQPYAGDNPWPPAAMGSPGWGGAPAFSVPDRQSASPRPPAEPDPAPWGMSGKRPPAYSAYPYPPPTQDYPAPTDKPASSGMGYPQFDPGIAPPPEQPDFSGALPSYPDYPPPISGTGSPIMPPSSGVVAMPPPLGMPDSPDAPPPFVDYTPPADTAQ